MPSRKNLVGILTAAVIVAMMAGMVVLAERFKGQEIFGHMTLTKSERSPLSALAAKML